MQLKTILKFFIVILFFSLPLKAIVREEKRIETPDGMTLRATAWKNENPRSDGLKVVLLQGRASFTEKHLETVDDLLARGIDVYTFDWRGHGKSTRTLSNPQKVHIKSYDPYLNDLEQFMTEIVHAKPDDFILFMGQSFGGHMAVRYLAEKENIVKGAVLLAPMLDVHTDPFPYTFARGVSQILCAVGLDEMYAFGYGDFDPKKASFEKNRNTHDKRRYARQTKLCEEHMDLVSGGPTFGWVKAMFESIDHTNRPEFLNRIKVPVLLINSGQDKVVNPLRDRELCQLMGNCTLKTYVDSYHNILNETDEIRARFWQDFDAFLEMLSLSLTHASGIRKFGSLREEQEDARKASQRRS